ncbi:DUF1178 family protein [Rhodobacter capsulatus]|jgi:hypothetical protein|uniref:DUF1178 family protein n=1 Tax=Rhodobacter capsulatus (strain ATCC BAA-309 / NBRC 16581 / SB1003) TaxID=272942 RepID=D5AMP0_RHOCB|nr:DUF1178 family protein [Rhodobacter capsulatus]ADE84179.1 protein of unknown function DUF1178 [Rhodobacter capsulatus SB 1003]ETD03282.1 hypothetical protein U714_02925 [Rhodobacter capsulatus DE442]ETD79551.1 hypothetical protein U717_02940 [Rhodobacter capsulatus R121]ETE55341.1 hypothetical protein U715_02925 [Rhodobacter capsulatus Y262]MDS0925863.1 DUF1178 family protein [Rhodobacter capsulatus]
MIRYTLKCDKEHSFDSWFASAAAYEALQARGMVSCTICGSTTVEKALMAPAVRPARKAAAAPAAEAPLSAPQTGIEEAFAAMRQAVEANSDYVGVNFVAEARAMHEGVKPERAIHGEARLDEAKALLDDGIPVMPLPFLPKRSRN